MTNVELNVRLWRYLQRLIAAGAEDAETAALYREVGKRVARRERWEIRQEGREAYVAGSRKLIPPERRSKP